MPLRFALYSAGVLAPGVSSLAELLTLFRTGKCGVSESLALPIPTMLPTNERRRASEVARLVLACAEQAMLTSPYPPDQLRCVFTSDEGTGDVCQQMLEALATTRQVSPLLFHNSVHNAPSGYFSIAYQNHQPAVSVSMGCESFASGLLCAVSEAATSGQPVLFLAYDPPLPEPMCSLLPIQQATATAWVIASDGRHDGTGTNEHSSVQPALASFELSLRHAGASPDQAPPKWLPDSWAANSSAQSFAVLALLADGHGSCEFVLGAQRLCVTLLDADLAC
jgi:Beta-ketoacyl synthase, N-terminal domain